MSGPDEPGVLGNSRLTASAGGILLLLLAIELATTLHLRTLMPAHVFVGVLLVGPLVLKLGTTGYRFARYYSGSVPYVRRGPPALPLRILAVPLVATTLLLVVSGGALLATGPTQPGPLIAIHNISTLVWLPLATVHAVAYVLRLPALLRPPGSWRAAVADTSRGWLGSTAVAVAFGIVGAVILLPSGAPWLAWAQSNDQVPAPVLVGTILTVVAVAVAKPSRWTSRERDVAGGRAKP